MKDNIDRNLWYSDLQSKGDTKYLYEICIFPDNSIIGTNTETLTDSVISAPMSRLPINEVIMWLSAVMDATESKQDKWILVYSHDGTQAAAACAAFVSMRQSGRAMDVLRSMAFQQFPKNLTELLKDWDFRV